VRDLVTICLILGGVASSVATLAYFDKRIRYNKARTRAQQGRISSLVQIIKLQGKRITIIEAYLSKENGANFKQILN
jgi:hypothetical protein